MLVLYAFGTERARFRVPCTLTRRYVPFTKKVRFFMFFVRHKSLNM